MCLSFVLVSFDLFLSGWPIIPNSASCPICWLISCETTLLACFGIWMFWVHLFAKEALIVDIDGKMTEEELLCHCSFHLITREQSKKPISSWLNQVPQTCWRIVESSSMQGLPEPLTLIRLYLSKMSKVDILSFALPIASLLHCFTWWAKGALGFASSLWEAPQHLGCQGFAPLSLLGHWAALVMIFLLVLPSQNFLCKAQDFVTDQNGVEWDRAYRFVATMLRCSLSAQISTRFDPHGMLLISPGATLCAWLRQRALVALQLCRKRMLGSANFVHQVRFRPWTSDFGMTDLDTHFCD